MSTDNKILSEYDSYIKSRESKNVAFLQDSIERLSSDFTSHLKSPIFRSWFLAFLSECHPDESVFMSFIDLFYKSMDNRDLVEDVKREETTLIFINLLYDHVEKALSTPESNGENVIPSPFCGKLPSMVTSDLWSIIQSKVKGLRDSIDPSGELVDEIYGLFKLVNERLVQHSRLYFQGFFESGLFKKRFSHNYMRKSCQHFLFQKPQIKMDIHKLEKPVNLATANHLTPKVPPKRDRVQTCVNQGKSIKESGDPAQGSLSKSLNIANDGL